MAVLTDLNIPQELEELWNKVLALKPNNLTLGASLTLPQQHYAKRQRSIARSYIPIFAPIYDALTSTQKINWAAYWLGLPFGDHVGANGWPGSGFSAFLYVNAPLQKAHEDLLLDPPGTDGNLYANSNFALNPFYNGWDSLGEADWLETQHILLSKNEGYLDYNLFGVAVGDTLRLDLRCKGLGPWADDEEYPDRPDNGGKYDFYLNIGSYNVNFVGYARNFKKFSITHTLTDADMDGPDDIFSGFYSYSGGIGCGYAGMFKL